MGDLVGEDAGDLLARHAAQQPFGQDDGGAIRAPQSVGIHIVRCRKAIEVRQTGQTSPVADLRQHVEQFGQFGGTQQARAEPPVNGFVPDCRTVLPRRASCQRPMHPLGSADNPAADREQQRHPGNRQCRGAMICGLLKRSPEKRQILRTEVDAAAQEKIRPIRRQMQVQNDARAGSHKLQHLPARRRTDQCK